MSEYVARRASARTQGPRNRTAPTISVVIPARNEAANLPAVIARLPKDLLEVILVDGNSTDATIEVARELIPAVRVFQQEGRGKGDALAVGFAAARGDIIVMLDADGSADAAEIPRFVAALIAGADFVKGSRFAQGGGSSDITPTRRLGNRVLCGLVNRAYGMNYTDLCYGYNAFWADCLQALQLAWPGSPLPAAASAPFGTGFEVETTLNIRAAKAGLTVWEVPSFERLRISGQSNLNAVRDGLRILRAILEESPGRALRRERAALAGLSLSPDVLAPPAPAAPADKLVRPAAVLATGEFLATVPHHESVNGNGHAPTLSGHKQ
jgi:glycosyltransferase involved in cell wall biosynthesis